MHVFLNPKCHYGQGHQIWRRIQPVLQKKYGQFTVEMIQPQNLDNQIHSALKTGETCLVAAGGDGTVNLLANAMLKNGFPIQQITLGAIGLGSSNDFHKPFRSKNIIRKIPVRLNWRQSQRADVIQVKYLVPNNGIVTRYCLNNASIGITAQANAFYNSKKPFIQFIQKLSVEAAIFATAVKTIMTYQNIPVVLHIDSSPAQSYPITNLGIIKNPHFAGNLWYNTPLQPDDGQLGIHFCADMSRIEAVKTLLGLYRGKFVNRPKTFSQTATRVRLNSARNFALEMDGEVVLTSSVEFQLIPQAMRCCQ
jgi:diacylglycerol kinase (ATP)